MCLVHTILGKKANRSSSLSQVVNYFDSSPSISSDHSPSLSLDSPLRHGTRPSDQTTPKQQHSSFYNPRQPSDTDEESISSEDENSSEYLRDQSPDFLQEPDDHKLRSRTRSLKGYILPQKRWPERLKGGSSSSGGSSGMGTGGSNSTTSLNGLQESITGGIGNGRPSSPESFIPINGLRGGSISDIGSEDLPMTKLSVSRNENYESRTLSPFVPSPPLASQYLWFQVLMCSQKVYKGLQLR